jgi:hypothetical protein
MPMSTSPQIQIHHRKFYNGGATAIADAKNQSFGFMSVLVNDKLTQTDPSKISPSVEPRLRPIQLDEIRASLESIWETDSINDCIMFVCLYGRFRSQSIELVKTRIQASNESILTMQDD